MSILLLLLLSVLGLLSLMFQIPILILGVCMAPFLPLCAWWVEFIYPTRLLGFCHMGLLQWWMKRQQHSSGSSSSSSDKNRGGHSRTLEQRVEVVKGRVYIHPIPQLVDNVAYLVVCCPLPNAEKMAHEDQSQEVDLLFPQQQQQSQHQTELGNITVLQQDHHHHHHDDDTALPPHLTTDPIVAFVVDCADASALMTHIEWIREWHYPNHATLQVQSILSTHKHHDHTAGNQSLVLHYSVSTVYGGAVERIPYCTHPVINGNVLVLPSSGLNDMNALVQVEVVAVPAHTRGSVTYALRPKVHDHETTTTAATTATPAAAFLFTGDTMFSGGAGVAFEADIDTAPEHKRTTDRTGRSFIKAGAGTNAIERCFAEILARAIPLAPPPLLSTSTTTTNNHAFSDASSSVMGDNVSNRIFIFPGHEYTTELLQRQFLQTVGDGCKWKLFAPSAFFDTVSQLYVAMHRRSLPHNSGKLLVVPSPLSREMNINPHYRLLRNRGDYVLRAVQLWHQYFCQRQNSSHPQQRENGMTRFYQERKKKMSSRFKNEGPFHSRRNRTTTTSKTPSLPDRWNVGMEDMTQPVFTTLYTSELDDLIQDLQAGNVDSTSAAKRLYRMKSVLDQPVVGRRPIPASLPPDKVVYKGILGLVLLGSPPCAFTKSDSRIMNMAPPVDRNSDKIRISMRRLITVLGGLGLLDDDEENEPQIVIPMIEALWQEAQDLSHSTSSSTPTTAAATSPDRLKALEPTNYNATTDLEDSSEQSDFVELGVLKWLLYGVTGMTPSWLGKYCLPCGNSSTSGSNDSSSSSYGQHPIQTSNMKQKHGELVRHDVLTCPLCRSATGCPDMADVQEYLQQQQQTTMARSRGAASTRSSQKVPLPVASAARRQRPPQALPSRSVPDTRGDNDIPPVVLRFSSMDEEEDDGESVEAVPLQAPFM